MTSAIVARRAAAGDDDAAGGTFAARPAKVLKLFGLCQQASSSPQLEADC